MTLQPEKSDEVCLQLGLSVRWEMHIKQSVIKFDNEAADLKIVEPIASAYTGS